MEKELQKANDELTSLLEMPNSGACGDPVAVDGDNKSQENNTPIISCEQVSVVEHENLETERVSVNLQYELFQQIDTICFNIYREIALVDEAFEEVSSNFYNLAEAYGKQALQDEDKDSQSVSMAVTATLAIGGGVIQGIGKLITAVQSQVTIRNKILPLLKREAEHKRVLVATLFDQVEEVCEGNLQIFLKQINTSYHMDSDALKKQQDFTALIQKPIVTSLNILRDSLYHYRLLEYLLGQFELWAKGEIGEDPMPDFGDINNEIIYRYIYDAPKGSANVEMQLGLKKALGLRNSLQDDQLYIPAGIYPIILDKQLLATALSRIENDGDNKFEDLANGEYRSCLKTALLSNAAYKAYSTLSDKYFGIESKRVLRAGVLALNTILITIISGIYSFRYFEDWWWSAIITLCIFCFCAKRSYSVFKRFDFLFEMKLEALKLYTLNRLQKMSGIKDNSRTLARINKGSASTIWGAIIGAIMGAVILSVVGFFIGMFLGSMFGGMEFEKYESDGSEYAEIKTGSGWLSYVIFALLVGGLIYIW